MLLVSPKGGGRHCWEAAPQSWAMGPSSQVSELMLARVAWSSQPRGLGEGLWAKLGLGGLRLEEVGRP